MGLLRLLLAVCVLESHLAEQSGSFDHSYGLGLAFGDVAVEMFFIISGFYMALVLHEKYQPGTYGTFILQRFLRLYPTYLLVLIGFFLVDASVMFGSGKPFGTLLYWGTYSSMLTPFTSLWYGLVNLTVLGQDTLYFFRQDSVSGAVYAGQPPAGSFTVLCAAFLLNPPSWSLALEFTFYLMAPWLVRRSLWVQGLLLASSVVLRLIFYYVASPWPAHAWVYFFFPSNLGFFIAGSLGYRFYRAHREKLDALGSWRWSALGGFLLLLLFYRRLPTPHSFDIILILLAVVLVPLIFALTRSNRRDRAIGELSYPFYLLHWHMIILVKAALAGLHPAWIEPLCLVLTLLLAWLVYYLFETKTERFREKLQPAGT